MTWEILVGLFTVITFFISVSSIVTKYVKENTKGITEITVNLKNLNETCLSIKDDVKVMKDKVNNHETRITILENKSE